jgi:hypothetical protein
LAVQRIRRQALTQYRDARTLLLLVDLFFSGVVVLELFRSVYPTAAVMMIYSLGAPILILCSSPSTGQRRRSIPVAAIDNHPFSRRLGAKAPSFQGRVMLLEVDPSANHGRVIRDFAVEQISNGSSFYAFTHEASPVRDALSGVEGVRLFIMTGEVSYPKPTERPFEMLLPQDDEAVLLDSIGRALSSSSDPRSPVAFAFDSLSDYVRRSGFERSYRFFRTAMEMISSSSQPDRVTALFLITAGALDERVRTIVMSLFACQLTFDSSGHLRITRV